MESTFALRFKSEDEAKRKARDDLRNMIKPSASGGGARLTCKLL